MESLILGIFLIGYLAISLEHPLQINKAASALLTGVLCWTCYVAFIPDPHSATHHLNEHLSEISSILFFLLGAMTIVELIDAHDGFDLITSKIQTRNKVTLLWIVGVVTFVLSAVLDNLTTTIVMVSLMRKILAVKEERLFFAGIIVIAANAGGAWSPIGDVTTTMLWVGNQITTSGIIAKTLLPSLVCLVAPLAILTFSMQGQLEDQVQMKKHPRTSAFEKNLIFGLGVCGLLFVPVFKVLTHLPPFMGMLFSLGVLWVITELLHSKKDTSDKSNLSVLYALRKIDTSSVLFFLGILTAVSCLETTGQLNQLAAWLDKNIGNNQLIVLAIGLLSSILDNVPLVAGVQGMYSMAQFPIDHDFWSFLAYAAGTGGSCLIIGSAAGVAAMGIEDINFLWYLRKISWLALVGYFAGAAAFILQQSILY